MFRHARKCGAQIFDGVKVDEVNFTPMSPVSDDSADESSQTSNKRPVSASWSSKADGKLGTINFDYIVDASGRTGVLNKYNKSRTYNKELNNVANWGYWGNTGRYAEGTDRQNAPFFEALLGK